MAKFLRIWSGVFAAIFLVGETLSNIAVNGKPVSILLPYYVVSALLIAGLFSRGYGAKLFLLGWGVALGYSYVAFADNLALLLGDDRLPDVAAIAESLSSQTTGIESQSLNLATAVFTLTWLAGIVDSYRVGRRRMGDGGHKI